IAVWAIYVLISHSRWPAVVVLVVATLLIDLVYLAPRRKTLPLKFLIPGTVFLIGFQIIPILFTIDVAFSNYSTGHILTQDQPTAAKGYTIITGAELFTLDQQLRDYKVPTTGDAAIQPQGTAIGVELRPTLLYDSKHNVFVRISDGKVYHDNGLGSFVSGAE